MGTRWGEERRREGNEVGRIREVGRGKEKGEEQGGKGKGEGRGTRLGGERGREGNEVGRGKGKGGERGREGKGEGRGTRWEGERGKGGERGGEGKGKGRGMRWGGEGGGERKGRTERRMQRVVSSSQHSWLVTPGTQASECMRDETKVTFPSSCCPQLLSTRWTPSGRGLALSP